MLKPLFTSFLLSLLSLPALAQLASDNSALAQGGALPPVGTARPVLAYADQMPTYPGGEAALHHYLAQKTEYPAEAKRRGLSGNVVVQFVVDEQGRLLDPVVARSSEPLFNAEALRLVRLMPWWTPGRQQREAVRVRYTLPIQFTFKR